MIFYDEYGSIIDMTVFIEGLLSENIEDKKRKFSNPRIEFMLNSEPVESVRILEISEDGVIRVDIRK